MASLNAMDVMSYEYADFANLFMSFWTSYVTHLECWRDSGIEKWFGPLPDPVSGTGRPLSGGDDPCACGFMCAFCVCVCVCVAFLSGCHVLCDVPGDEGSGPSPPQGIL